MTIFCFTAKPGQAYLHSTPEVFRQCDPSPPRSLVRGWVAPTFEFVTRDEYRNNLPKTDFPNLGCGTAVLSARAVDRLHPVLTPCGELLPIRCSNDPDEFYLFNVTRIINAVDTSRSKFQILPSGAIGECELLVFDPKKLTDALFFKNTQMGSHYDIFASDVVVETVKKAGVTGFDFVPVWASS